MGMGVTASAAKPIAAPSAARRSAPRYSQAELQALKERDNSTNFRYIGLIYLVVVATIAATMWVYSAIQAGTLSGWWSVPVTFLAIVSIGASQHQLGGVVHEGTHYILFANRKMNELVSDWLAAFQIYTSTYA